MGNTANNNWPYPESTDLVKDGATAIENLADAIDTTLGVFVPSSPGLTLINTTSFSGVASQSLATSTFTSSYDNYLITSSNLFSSVNAVNLFFRLRKSGTDNTANDYFRAGYAASATLTASQQTDTQLFLGTLSSTATSISWLELKLYNPLVNGRTGIQYDMFRANADTTQSAGGTHYVADTFDAITIYPASGTITGSISVYGFNK
jgi:hypothetical protein